MSEYLSKKYKSLKAYTPGEQLNDKEYIKLNTNESPYPPAPSVVECVNSSSIENLRLYSDPECKLLKNELAKTYGVESENVFVSNGSDETLNFAFMAFGDEGVAFSDITYGFYEVYAKLYSCDTLILPLEKDFSLDWKKYLNIGKMIVIANPNAPTGKILPLNEIEQIVKSNPKNIVLVDEAYIDFGGESAVGLINKYDNLLVVMTFSKSRSMAGARLGFAIANKKIIQDLELIKYSTNPYNVNALTQLLGVETLKNNEYYVKNCKKIQKTRENLTLKLRELDFFVIDSMANFVFAKHKSLTGKEIYTELRKNGVLVRHFYKDRIQDFNRITIGSDEQADRLVKTLEKILIERK